MKKLKVYLLILTGVLLFYSCKKDETIDYTNSEYVANSFTKDGPLKVYTNKGQLITEMDKIKKFIANEDVFNRDQDNIPQGEKIKFISSDSVYVLASDGRIIQRFAYVIQGKSIFFTETTISSMVFNNSSQELLRTIQKYQPQILESIPISSVGGVFYRNLIKYTSIGTFTRDGLVLNNFSFKIYKGSGSFWNIYSSTINNQFNESFLETLSTTDTLAIQPFLLNFKKN